MSGRNPGAAAVLSFVFTGPGQICNGRIKNMFIVGIVMVCWSGVYSIFDAYKNA